MYALSHIANPHSPSLSCVEERYFSPAVVLGGGKMYGFSLFYFCLFCLVVLIFISGGIFQSQILWCQHVSHAALHIVVPPLPLSHLSSWCTQQKIYRYILTYKSNAFLFQSQVYLYKLIGLHLNVLAWEMSFNPENSGHVPAQWMLPIDECHHDTAQRQHIHYNTTNLKQYVTCPIMALGHRQSRPSSKQWLFVEC